MNKRLRTHLYAIGAICFVITILYLLAGPKAPTPEEQAAKSPYKISIVSASWGLNCNSAIREAIELHKSVNAPVLTEGETPPVLKPVERDNALEGVRARCENNPRCEILATSEVMGSDPYAGCFKKLDITYRCYDIDRLRTLQGDQGDILRLDCTSIDTPADAAKPNNAK